MLKIQLLSQEINYMYRAGYLLVGCWLLVLVSAVDVLCEEVCGRWFGTGCHQVMFTVDGGNIFTTVEWQRQYHADIRYCTNI